MTAPSPDSTADLIDLAGRIMLTHAIDPCHLVNLLGVDKLDAQEMIRTGQNSVVPGDNWHDRLQLFVNILVRLECRLRHDSRAIRRAMGSRIDAAHGRSAADEFGGSLDDLRTIRRAIEKLELPQEKWWRVGH
jgi:hypothetical protein